MLPIDEIKDFLDYKVNEFNIEIQHLSDIEAFAR